MSTFLMNQIKSARVVGEQMDRGKTETDGFL